MLDFVAVGMHFLILGASGRTGKLAVTDALNRGHTVTALVRKASSIEPREGLAIVQGTPEKQTDIKAAIAARQVDVALVLLNAARESDSPFAKPITPEFFLRDCVRNVMAAMSHTGRIIVMSAFGIGSSSVESSWMLKALFRYTNMKYQMRDHEIVDGEVGDQERMDWTLVRPPMLKDGGAQPVKERGETGKGMGLFDSITRASVARFMVEEAENGEYKRQAVVISN